MKRQITVKFDDFDKAVYAVLSQVPAGRVVSYGALAFLAGYPRAARRAGLAMRRCPDSLPWQRVVHSDGSVSGGYFPELRRALLEGEGVIFGSSGKIDMEKYGWRGEE